MLKQVDLSRVDLNLLVLFETVLAERHVGRAAERLHLSPSAVSHGLGRLRQLLHDPLFLRHPKGVVPTARAESLAEPVADVLAGVRRVMASAERFVPATSTRRFVIGTPDAIGAVILPPLLRAVRRAAPGIDLAMRAVLPPWETALADLDLRALDLAILPIDDVPARFVAHHFYEERFVIAMRRGHPLGRTPTRERYCAAEHVLVSHTGDPFGLVDQILAAHGLTRRVALVVPSFMLALALVAESDLVVAVPARLVKAHAERLGLVAAPVPVPVPPSQIRVIASRAATADAGLQWVLDRLTGVVGDRATARRSKRAAPRRRGA